MDSSYILQGVKYETFRMYKINPVQLYHCLLFQTLIHWLIPSTNYMTCTVLHYVQQTTWLAQSYTMFNKLHDLHSLTLHSTNYISLTLCSTNYMSLTLCSTNYMTCTVLHYIQQTTWVLHYVQQTTWVLHYVQQTTSLAQSYTTFNKLHDLHSHKTTPKIQTKYWTFSAAMIFSCYIKYSRLSWVHPPFSSHSTI